MSKLTAKAADIVDEFTVEMTDLFSAGSGGEKAGFSQVEVGATSTHMGRPVMRASSRKFPGIDLLSAKKSELRIEVTSNAVMSTVQAGKAMEMLIARNNMANETDSKKKAFVDGMLLAMAMNSSSVRMPGRAEFGVRGAEKPFNLFTDVVEVLGADTRRFFRAYADEVRDLLKGLKERVASGPLDTSDESYELWEDEEGMWRTILHVANERGLERVPTLVHDSASFCSGLTAHEKAFLNASKVSIFAGNSSWNAVDNPVVPRSGRSEGREGAVGKPGPAQGGDELPSHYG